MKNLPVFFAAALLAGGIQHKIFSQTVTDSGAAAAGVDAERGLVLGEAVSAPDIGAGGPSILTVFSGVIVLALCAAAIYGVVYILKRKKDGGAPEGAHLKVLARVPITVKTAAAVISIGGKAWLTGVSDNNVSVIAEITDRETVDAMLLDYSQRSVNVNGAPRIDFAGLLRALAGGSGRPASRPPEIAGMPQTLNLQRNRERLKNL